MGTDQTAAGRRDSRHIVSMSFSLFITLGFIALIAVLVLQWTLLRPSFMLEQADASGYTAVILEDVENTWVSYGMSGGFDEAFFEGLLNEDEIRADIFLSAERLYDPNLSGVNVEEIQESLHEKMRAYITEHGEEISSEMDEALLYLANLCAEAYDKAVSIPFSSQLSSVLVKLSKLVLPAIAACILFIAVMVFFLIRIQRIKYRSFKYLIYALCASGLFFIAVALVALGTDYLARIGISGQGLYRLILTYATSIFDLMLWVGGGAVIVSAICASVYMYYRKQRKKAYRSA